MISGKAAILYAHKISSSGAEVKHTWSHIYTSPCAFIGWWLHKHSNSFIFFPYTHMYGGPVSRIYRATYVKTCCKYWI